MLFKTVLDKTIDFVYPHKCPICNTIILNSTDYICKNCRSQIYFNQPPYCKLCGVHLSNTKQLCKTCAELLSTENYKFWYDKTVSYFIYKDTLRKILHIIKYKNDLKLTKYIGNKFAKMVKNDKSISKIDYVTPVPLYFKKKLRRGFDQTEIFSKMISKETKIKLIPDLIYRKKNTIPQSELSRTKRAQNVKNAFAISKRYNIKYSNILLIDDIFTTGATVNECARLLKQNGANYILVVTLARG